MTMKPFALATICARGGSKGLPGKNLRRLEGRPLIAHAIECARVCPEIGDIVVSTDDEAIAKAAEDAGARVPFRRPPELATDEAPKVGAIRHATEWFERTNRRHPDVVVDLDVGVPLRTPGDVSACIRLLRTDPTLDAAVTVYEAERSPYFNMVELDGHVAQLVKAPPTPVFRRQDAPKVYSVSPAVFAWRRNRLDVRHIFEGRWGAVPIPRDRAVDIDTELDFLVVEQLLGRRTPKVAR